MKYMPVLFTLLFINNSFADQSYKSYFTSDELSVMQNAEELLVNYQPVVFTVVQVIDEDTLLVKSGDFSYIFKKNAAGVSDGNVVSGLARREGTYTFTTVLGSQRTLEQYKSISQDDLEIIEASVPLFEKKELVVAEIEREKSASRYEKNKEAMLEIEDLANTFLKYTENSQDEEVLGFRAELEELIGTFGVSHRSSEYSGEELNAAAVEGISNDVALYSKIYDREQRAVEAQREQDMRDRELRRQEARQQMEAKAQQQLEDFAEISKLYTLLEAVNNMDPYNLSGNQKFVKLQEMGYSKAEINQINGYAMRVKNYRYLKKENSAMWKRISNMDEYLESNFRLVNLADLKGICQRIEELDPDSYFEAEFQMEGKPSLFFVE